MRRGERTSLNLKLGKREKLYRKYLYNAIEREKEKGKHEVYINQYSHRDRDIFTYI